MEGQGEGGGSQLIFENESRRHGRRPKTSWDASLLLCCACKRTVRTAPKREGRGGARHHVRMMARARCCFRGAKISRARSSTHNREHHVEQRERTQPGRDRGEQREARVRFTADALLVASRRAELAVCVLVDWQNGEHGADADEYLEQAWRQPRSTSAFSLSLTSCSTTDLGMRPR